MIKHRKSSVRTTTNEQPKEYFDWVCKEFVNLPPRKARTFRGLPDEMRDVNFDERATYHKLLHQLYKEELFDNFTVANDCNRALDGMELRNDWCTQNDQPSIEWNEEVDTCSFFEMMCGLAMRLEFEAWDVNSYVNYTAPFWFWILAANVGLTKYTDDYYDCNPDESVRGVHDICVTVNDRTYEPNGHGGFFPIEDPCQRDRELWYQMDNYIYRRDEY